MDLDIIKIAANNKNNKFLDNHTHSSRLKNSICGDEIQIKLIIKKNKIVDFAYQEKSCVYCQASASLLSKISINKSKDIINNLCKDAESFFEQKNAFADQFFVVEDLTPLNSNRILANAKALHIQQLCQFLAILTTLSLQMFRQHLHRIFVRRTDRLDTKKRRRKEQIMNNIDWKDKLLKTEAEAGMKE